MISGGAGLRRLRVLGVRAILVPVVLVTFYSRDICVVYVFLSATCVLFIRGDFHVVEV